jgi:hypothetical protein
MPQNLPGHCEEAMNRKNELLLTDEPVEFEAKPVEAQELQDIVMNWQMDVHCDELKNLPCGTAPKLQLPPGVAMVLK